MRSFGMLRAFVKMFANARSAVIIFRAEFFFLGGGGSAKQAQGVRGTLAPASRVMFMEAIAQQLDVGELRHVCESQRYSLRPRSSIHAGLEAAIISFTFE